MKIKYKIKQCNNFSEPYWYNDGLDNFIEEHNCIDEYVTFDKDIFNALLSDFIDAPKKKLTNEDVRKDFDDVKYRLSDNKVEAIKTYYNGRFNLKKKIEASIKKIDVKKIDKMSSIVMRFNIPIEINYLFIEDNDAKVKQNEAYIEFEISKVDDKGDNK